VGDLPTSSLKLALAQIALSALRAGTKLQVSTGLHTQVLDHWSQLTGCEVIVEDLDSMQKRLGALMGGTVRVLGDVGVPTLDPLSINKAFVAYGPPLSNGRLELQLYVREQAISETVHRYGNLV
jgi:RHH-type proline utilization regulon transcriptional repressor/proline dehydrogenase/delta 1-pyrroline-5-carboxylate dehydrogenase